MDFNTTDQWTIKGLRKVKDIGKSCDKKYLLDFTLNRNFLKGSLKDMSDYY